MKKTSLPTFISAILAFCAVYSMTYIIKLQGKETLAISNSFFSLILIVFSYAVIQKGCTYIKKRNLIFSAVYGIIFSAMLVIGTEIYTTGRINYEISAIFHKIFLILSFGIFLTACLLCLLRWISTHTLHKEWKMPRYVTIWLTLILCWLPAYLALYPGCIAYDSPAQTSQWVYHRFTTHHPLWHTIYMGIFTSLGERIDNITLAMGLHVFSQMLLFSAMLAYVVWKLRDFHVPSAISLGALLFFALFPIHSVFAISTTKDVLFSGLLLLVIIFILDMFRDFEHFKHSFFCIIRFVLTVILMCNFRNNGIYAFLVMIPFVLLLKGKKRTIVFLLCISSVILSIAASKATVAALHAEKGSVAEMLSSPIQQFARIYTLHEEELPEDIQKEMTCFIDEEKILLYNPYLADPVKDGFQAEYFNEHKLNFIKLWGKLFLAYPGDSIDAFLITSLGNWYPDMNYPNMHDYMELDVRENYIELVMPDRKVQPHRDSKLPRLEPYYNLLSRETPHQKLPGISMLFNPGFYSWFLLFTIGYLLYRRQYEQTLALLPLLGLWLTLLLSPIALMRYSYPFMLCAPVFTALIYKASHSE